jgi:hypothetical protein
MGGWRRYLELQARAKTGLSSGVLVSALLGLIFAIVTFAFILVTVFIWLGERYGPLPAALALTGFFLLAAIMALICCISMRRRTIERAELALASRRNPIWLEPKLVAGAVQASRAVGWGKVATLLAVGVLAAGVGALWFGRDKWLGESDARDEGHERDSRGGFARAA